MATFTLDTEGEVIVLAGERYPHKFRFSDLSPFCQGYVEAALRNVEDLWRLTDLPPEGPSRRGPYWVAFRDLDPATLAQMIADCEVLAARVRDIVPTDERQGGVTWDSRQAGNIPDFLPLTLSLSETGKVIAREGRS